jgi:uncharacterized protein (DUF1499 family)
MAMNADFPLDFATLKRRGTPNQFLVLPPGFKAVSTPDRESPVFEADAHALLDAFAAYALAQPRVTKTRHEAGQVELIQRTALIGFPDYITAQAISLGKRKSALAIYSRSKYGRSDLGVNAKRIGNWLAGLNVI